MTQEMRQEQATTQPSDHAGAQLDEVNVYLEKQRHLAAHLRTMRRSDALSFLFKYCRRRMPGKMLINDEMVYLLVNGISTADREKFIARIQKHTNPEMALDLRQRANQLKDEQQARTAKVGQAAMEQIRSILQ